MRPSHTTVAPLEIPVPVLPEGKKILFEDFKISPVVLKALAKMGFKEPSPIQVSTLEFALKGSDVIGQAQTGTGKTAAFGIPIIEKIDPSDRRVQALIMAPTRELAIQVSEEINRIGKEKGVSSLPVYGGQSIIIQLDGLRRGTHIVVGTPGRLIDHVKRKTLRLQHVHTVVLDEADIMLDMGFIDDITTLLKETPSERQTLLFSATLSEPILQIGRKYMRNPNEIRISKKNVTVESVTQVYYETSGHHRFDALCRILDVYQPQLTLIFCETKQNVDTLTSRLNKAGHVSEAIHGDLSQAQRDKVMKKFRDGIVKILVATDVAARGLNVSAVSHVINYNLPKNTETYIHRIGRTGRAGLEGVAITLISPHEFRDLKTIQAQSKTRIEKKELPSDHEVKNARIKGVQHQIELVLKKGAVNKYSPWLAELYALFTPEDVASALLYLFDHVDPVEIHEKEDFKNRSRSDSRPDFRRNDRGEGRRERSFSRKPRGFESEKRERPAEKRYGVKKEAVRGKEVYMMPVMTRARRPKPSSS